ncbi:TolC family protein [Saccharicrinis aurantiacus]|uniref:TolC family protein n=1 Tax=Saccharicrinis aurantiacus TaxID=1849719 RepID=UPI000837F3DB|nr:TolC family protein [Saccharicrinis aurantiacus]
MKHIIILFFFAILCNVGFAQKQLRIGILDEKINSESDLYLDQLKKEINSLVGKGSNVVFNQVLFNNYDINKAKENYNQLIDLQSDIIISFGVVNTIMLYQQQNYIKPTIIVGAINNDLVDIPLGQLTSGVNNLTYLVTPFSYKEDLDTFKELTNFQNIGIFVDQYLLDLLPIEGVFQEYFREQASTYKLIGLNKDSNIESLVSDIDAAYLVSYNSISNNQFGTLIDSINAKKIPSLTGYGVTDVERGVLASNQPEVNFTQIFRRIALNVEEINGGENASNLPLHINYSKQLSINSSTANQIGFPIRNSMLVKVNLIEGDKTSYADNIYSMIDIMNGVVDSNLGLAAERQNIELSKQDVKSSKSQYLPDLGANVSAAYADPDLAEASSGQNPEFSTAANVSLSQVIYSEQASANISIQKNILASQKESYNASELDALLNASILYYNALVLKTNLSIQSFNLKLTKQNLEIALQNYELGESGQSDVLRFKSQLAQNTQSVIESRNSLSQAYFDINQLLNKPISDQIELKDTLIGNVLNDQSSYAFLLKALDDPSQQQVLVNFFIEEAKRNVPELKNIDYNLEAVERNFRLNDKGRFVPTLALQGQYNHTLSKSGAGSTTPAGFPVIPDGFYNVGVSLSLPIFQQSTRNINRQSALIQQDQLNIQKEDFELSIEKNINAIVLDIINEITNIEISKVDLEFAKKSLELSQNEYQNGVIPVIQLIDAQNNYFQAHIANATAQYNFRIVSMKLQRMIGNFFDMNSEAKNDDFVLRAKQFIMD